jgi:hypothetical protein
MPERDNDGQGQGENDHHEAFFILVKSGGKCEGVFS